jgi:hypothetical protein
MPLGRPMKSQVELKLNGTHQLLVYADINLLVDNIKRNTETQGY